MKSLSFFRRLTSLSLLLAGLSFLGSCNFGTAPGGTEGEGLTGILLDTRGAAIRNVKVRVHPDTAATLAKSSAVKAAMEDSAFTNAEGRFDFTKLVKGARYNLSASFTRDDTVYSLLIKDIVYGGGRQDLGNNALVVSGGITLRIQIDGSAPPAGSLCSIARSPYQSVVTDSGTCILTGLPPGTFQVEIAAPGYRIALSDAVTVIQRILQNGGSVNLVPLNGPVRPADQQYDVLGSTIALWTFNAYATGSGNRFLDQGTGGFTLAGAQRPVLEASPKGSAVIFNGSGETFSAVADSTFFPGSRTLTLEARIRLSAYPSASNNDSAGWVVGCKDGIRLLIGSNGSLRLAGPQTSVVTGAGPLSWITDPVAYSAAGKVPLNEWVHVAVAVNLDPAGSQSYAYINGAPVQLYRGGGQVQVLAIPSSSLILVGNGASGGQSLNGRVDEIRISNALVLGPGLPLILQGDTVSTNLNHFTKTSATIAQWTFDEKTNGKFADLSGNGHDLTPPAASTLAASPYDSAVTFNGALITRTDNALMLAGNTRITYEARIRLSAYPSASLLNRQAHLIGNYAGLSLYIGSEGWIQVVAQKGGDASNWNWWGGNTLPGTVPLNEWVDVAAAADRTTGKVYAYVNGKPVVLFIPAADVSGTLRAYDASSFDLGGSSVDGQLFPGQIDEVRVSSDLPLGAGPDLIVAPYSNPDPARVFPAVPVLAAPAQGAAVSMPVALSWGSVTEASVYFVEVASDSAFTSNVFSDSLVLQTSRTVSDLPDGSYFWRVRARNGAGTSGYSTVRRFVAATGN